MTFSKVYANISMSFIKIKMKNLEYTTTQHDVAKSQYADHSPKIRANRTALGHVAINTPENIPPRIYRLEQDIDVPLDVRTSSFKEARAGIKKQFSDQFIDDALTSMDGNLRIGDNTEYYIKNYMDQVLMTPKDVDIVRDPRRIAAVYGANSDMILRNFRVMYATNSTPERKEQIVKSKNDYMHFLRGQIPLVERGIDSWCNGLSNDFPVDEIEYKGFDIDGRDILAADGKGLMDVESNFKIQRQLGGSFIMATSDAKIIEQKTSDKREESTRRIYLNPDIETTPIVFEEILRMANDRGIKLKLKMSQRVGELATRHKKTENGGNIVGTLRGDGIVIYCNDKYEDEVLEQVLIIVEHHAKSFRGRETSRTPAKITDGVSIGDEPSDVDGKESLTSHRATIIERALGTVRNSGKQGVDARNMFRVEFAKLARIHNVSEDNFAFNSKY